MKIEIVLIGILVLIVIGVVATFCYAGYDVKVDMDIIGMLESSGGMNQRAYDVHRYAVGRYQVSFGVLKGYNKAHGTNYTKVDLLNDEICYNVAYWYLYERLPAILRAWGLEDTLDARLICYNWGVGNYRKHINNQKRLPKETREYLLKYKKLKGRKDLCPRTNKTLYEENGGA